MANNHGAEFFFVERGDMRYHRPEDGIIKFKKFHIIDEVIIKCVYTRVIIVIEWLKFIWLPFKTNHFTFWQFSHFRIVTSLKEDDFAQIWMVMAETIDVDVCVTRES